MGTRISCSWYFYGIVALVIIMSPRRSAVTEIMKCVESHFLSTTNVWSGFDTRRWLIDVLVIGNDWLNPPPDPHAETPYINNSIKQLPKQRRQKKPPREYIIRIICFFVTAAATSLKISLILIFWHGNGACFDIRFIQPFVIIIRVDNFGVAHSAFERFTVAARVVGSALLQRPRTPH